MKTYTMTAAAKLLKINRTKLYRIIKNNREQYEQYEHTSATGVKTITAAGIEAIRERLDVVADCSPEQQMNNVNNKSEQPYNQDESEITFLRQTVNNLINQLSEERQRSDTIIMTLTRDLERQREAILLLESRIREENEEEFELEDPDVTDCGDDATEYFENELQAAEIPEYQLPKERMPFYKVWWYELFDPKKLRA